MNNIIKKYIGKSSLMMAFALMATGTAMTSCSDDTLSNITTHAGDITRNVVGTCAKLLLASVKFVKEPAVEFLYGIILRGGDT